MTTATLRRAPRWHDVLTHDWTPRDWFSARGMLLRAHFILVSAGITVCVFLLAAHYLPAALQVPGTLAIVVAGAAATVRLFPDPPATHEIEVDIVPREPTPADQAVLPHILSVVDAGERVNALRSVMEHADNPRDRVEARAEMPEAMAALRAALINLGVARRLENKSYVLTVRPS